MGLKNKNTGEYLKVTDYCFISEKAEEQLIEGVRPYCIQFNVSFDIYESYEARLQYPANKWKKPEQSGKTYHSIPDLPEGWEPLNPDTKDKEKIKVMAYTLLKSDPEFADYEDYQPVNTSK